jgi:hypothetical protein
MPRNSSGVYTLPAGNPVVADTIIDVDWANPTMADLGNEITLSLPRNGSAGMLGPLTLIGNAVSPLQAVPLQQVQSISGNFVPLSGGTLTGQLKGITPVAPEDLTRKDYVDTKVAQTAPTGAAVIPSGTDAQRPVGVNGYFRYNNEQGLFEGFTPSGWGQVGGGQMYGKAQVKAIFYNANTIAENIDVVAGQNGLTAGPVTVENGFAVTVANGSVWTVV